MHGLARGAGKIALDPLHRAAGGISVFFLTNPMAYTFGSFLGRSTRQAWSSIDAAVSYVYPPLGLSSAHQSRRIFRLGRRARGAARSREEARPVVGGYHIQVAIWYAIVGLDRHPAEGHAH